MELLATVMVVVLLAALLFPATKNVVARGKEVTCANNLRQIGQAFNSYAAENDGTLLSPKNNDRSISSGSSWSIMLINYMGLKFPKMNQKNLFLCPAAHETYPHHDARRTYAMNYQNLPTAGSGIAASRGYEQKTKLVQHTSPSQTVLLIDSRGTVTDGSGSDSFTLATYQQSGDWRHNGGLNSLFLDGHVEKFGKSDNSRLEECINRFAR